jgi:hypothetical protein
MPDLQDVALELFYDGEWHDIVGDDEVLTDSPITIVRGQGAEGAAFRPAQITASLLNFSEKWSTSNPLSPLYGRAGRNTPVRVLVDGDVRGTAELSSLAPDEDQHYRPARIGPDGRRYPARGRAWADLDAGGVLRRLGQWSKPIESPTRYRLRTAVSNVIGYFPMEDERGTERAASAVPGARNTRLGGLAFESQYKLPGTGTMADLLDADDAIFSFVDPGPGSETSTAGWQVGCFLYIGDIGNDSAPINLITTRLRNGWSVYCYLQPSTDNVGILVADGASNTIVSFQTDWLDFQWEGRPIHVVCEASYSGGTTEIGFAYRYVEDYSWTGISDTWSGVTSTPAQAEFRAIAAIGHLIATSSHPFGINGISDFSHFDAYLGHPGERAAERFARLCEQYGIPYYVSTSWATSMPMGPQQPGKILEIFRECVTTEDALLMDYRDESRVWFVARQDRYGQSPGIRIPVGDLPRRPREVVDDLDSHNIVTVSQRFGEEVTVRRDTGPMSTLPPPDGIGEYEQQIDVNLDDPDGLLGQIAGWWLSKGTNPEPRYPTVEINMVPLTALQRAQVAALDIGDVFQLQDYRPGTDINLMIVGSKEVIGATSRRITFTCMPATMFAGTEYDDDGARYDVATCTTPAVDRDAASIVLAITADESWSTTSTPYDVEIGGEVVRVTAMGARSGTLGAYSQTATVIRGLNGVRKSHDAGTEVHVVATSGRYLL